jgi:hypothetical protein
MTMRSGMICQRCGAALTSLAGRCPNCDAPQSGSEEITKIDLDMPTPLPNAPRPTAPAAHTAPRASTRPRSMRVPAPPPPKNTRLWILAPLLIVLGTVVTIAVLRSNQMAREEAAQRLALDELRRAQAAEPSPVPKVAPSLINLWNEASDLSRAWNKNAMLIQMQAQSLAPNAALDSNDGSARFEFGAPARDSNEPMTHSGRDHFVVTIDKTGTRSAATHAAPGAIMVPEPQCPAEKALRVGPAVGFDANQNRTLAYLWNAAVDRSTWVVGDPSDPKRKRTLDGSTCVIIVVP